MSNQGFAALIANRSLLPLFELLRTNLLRDLGASESPRQRRGRHSGILFQAA
jgi:hypothetical protein